MCHVVDWLALGVSIISLIISFIAKNKSSDMQAGSIEMEIRTMITNAKNRFADLGLQLENNPNSETLKKAVNSALEEVCNAYNEACAKYLDGKVDKRRFKKNYINEIKNIVTAESTKNKFIPPQTNYHATVSVYNKWHNLEE
ncbi:MAG: hypothetical protein Q4E83_02045 [bacterium]|nr:hypothetical protein [bacterium]